MKGIANQREASRRWNKGHLQRMKEAQRRWAAKNPEKIKAINHKYRSTHIDIVLESNLRRRMRERGNGVIERIYRNVVWSRDDGICGICKLPVKGKWELDHRIPIARGGPHTYANVQVAHPKCNRHKGAKMKIEELQDEALQLLFNRPTSNDVEVLEWVRDRAKWLGLDKQGQGQLLGAYLALEKKEAEK